MSYYPADHWQLLPDDNLRHNDYVHDNAGNPQTNIAPFDDAHFHETAPLKRVNSLEEEEPTDEARESYLIDKAYEKEYTIPVVKTPDDSFIQRKSQCSSAKGLSHAQLQQRAILEDIKARNRNESRRVAEYFGKSVQKVQETHDYVSDK